MMGSGMITTVSACLKANRALNNELTTGLVDSAVSKLGDAKLHSSAAYLLFYRRRSATPLGPQYLQDLVHDYRNPPEAEQQPSADEAAAEEDESGEGRLGGPTSSLHGSSSALVAAGAGTNGSASASTRANGSAGVGSSLTTKTTTTSMGTSRLGSEEAAADEGGGVRFFGPERPPHMRQYGSQSTLR